MIAVRSSAKSGWLIPTGLIFLSLLPLAGATNRLAQLFGGAAITPDNARFFAAPVPIVLHSLSSIVYFVLGAFQFSPTFRNRHREWHRAAGKILIPLGLLSASSGVWMAINYPPLFGDGIAVRYVRLAVGTAMIAFIVLGFRAIKRRNFAHHRAWMMRAYALGIGAGTQPFTLPIMFAFPAAQVELGYTLGLTAGWVLNAIVAEWLIARLRVIDRQAQTSLR